MKDTASKISNPLIDQENSDDGTDDIDVRKVEPIPRYTRSMFQRAKKYYHQNHLYWMTMMVTIVMASNIFKN